MIRHIAALVLGAALIAPNDAAAQQNCAARATVIERLAGQYGESRQSIGMGTEGRVVEVFASPQTRTWTITVTLPSGLTCLVASGEAFENLNESPRPEGTPS